MKKNNNWGNLMMAVGLLLIAAALLLTVKNIREEENARVSSEQILMQMQQTFPEIQIAGEPVAQTAAPQITDATELQNAVAEGQVHISDRNGNAVSWPMDEESTPVPLPVNSPEEPPERVISSEGQDTIAQTAVPQITDATELQSTVVEGQVHISDRNGNAVSWPMDEEGKPVPWPVNSRGEPLERMIFADGQETVWPADTSGNPLPWRIGEGKNSASLWTETADGALLPWVSDEQGHTIPWPIDVDGHQMDWNTVQHFFYSILDGLLKNYTSPVPQAIFEIQQEIEMPMAEISGNYYIGVLSLTERGMDFPIMSDWSYSKLRIAPCRYTGSVYNGSLVIAGHNYSGHFGTVRKMQAGEKLSFTDVDGNIFYYEVSAVEWVDKTDVTGMTQGDWDMTLFTCVSGTRYRFAVRCVKIGYQVAR